MRLRAAGAVLLASSAVAAEGPRVVKLSCESFVLMLEQAPELGERK